MPVRTPMPSSMGENIRLAPRPPAASSAAPSRPTITLSTKTVAIWDRKAIAIGSARARLAPASSIQVARPAGRAVAPAVMMSPERLGARRLQSRVTPEGGECHGDDGLGVEARLRVLHFGLVMVDEVVRQDHRADLEAAIELSGARQELQHLRGEAAHRTFLHGDQHLVLGRQT